MHTTSRIDMYENLQRAAGFDANRTYPALFQHLGYRKLLAEQMDGRFCLGRIYSPEERSLPAKDYKSPEELFADFFVPEKMPYHLGL